MAIRFLKLQMPKSWHFLAHGELAAPAIGDAASVQSSHTEEEVNLLVVEPGENAALCFAGPTRRDHCRASHAVR
ncbi:cell division protein ZapC domain-containing protein [Shigella flexneri]